jgi:hypothetical protein
MKFISLTLGDPQKTQVTINADQIATMRQAGPLTSIVMVGINAELHVTETVGEILAMLPVEATK